MVVHGGNRAREQAPRKTAGNTGTSELRINAGDDAFTGRRLQRSFMFEGSARDADRRLAELTVEFANCHVQSGNHTLADVRTGGGPTTAQ